MTSRLDVDSPSPARDLPGSVPAIVLPSPLATLISGAAGTAVGFAVVYTLARSQVHQLFGVLVMAILLTLALVGPQILTNARTDLARVLAVAFGALAFGGAFAGLLVSFVH